MSGSRPFILTAISIAVFAAQCMFLHAQVASSPPSQGPSIAVRLAMEKDHISLGQKPRAVVTIKNITQQKIYISTASRIYRVYVEGKDGGPPETEWQRHRHGDFRPGDTEALVDGPIDSREIAPGGSDTQIWELTVFYDLSVQGKYTLYMEIRDEPKGPSGPSVWLRTNTVQFEIESPAQ